MSSAMGLDERYDIRRQAHVRIKLVWNLPDVYPDVISRECKSHPLDQSHQGKSLIFTKPI
jgi:hypothetical protein